MVQERLALTSRFHFARSKLADSQVSNTRRQLTSGAVFLSGIGSGLGGTARLLRNFGLRSPYLIPRVPVEDDTRAVKASIVIPTFNRREMLARTLPSLLAQDFPPDAYEIIVVCDGCTDNTAAWLRAVRSPCAIHVIEQANRGPGLARNAGIRAARGELILLLDDDFISDPTLVREHVAAHAAGCRLVIGRSVVADEAPRTLAADRRRAYTKTYFPPHPLPPPLPWLPYASASANTSFPRRLWEQAGGFDPQFSRMCEDIDLGLRFCRLGARLQYCPSAVAHEIYDKTGVGYVRFSAPWDGNAELMLCRKHPEYRAHSGLASISPASPLRRLASQLAVRFPFDPVPLAFPLIGAAESFPGFAPLRRLGIRAMDAALRTAMLRTAIRATGSFGALKGEYGVRAPALMYHHVGPFRPGTYASLTVTAANFERQVRWLARQGYTGITASAWCAWQREARPLPDKPILITFDDGYADLAEYAFPVLRKYGFSATVFVVTGCIGGTNLWDQESGSAPHRLLNADQLRFWSAQGIEFGSHSRTHHALTNIPLPAVLQEVEGSKRDLEALLEAPVSAFCYPFGECNQAVVEVVRRGYDLAFAADGDNDLRTDPHRLRRVMIGSGDSLLDFRFRVLWARNPLDWLRAQGVRLKRLLKLPPRSAFVPSH